MKDSAGGKRQSNQGAGMDCASRRTRLNIPVSHCEEGVHHGFSGIRALIIIAVLVILVVGMSRFDLPGWIVPVGVLATAALLKPRKKSAPTQ